LCCQQYSAWSECTDVQAGLAINLAAKAHHLPFHNGFDLIVSSIFDADVGCLWLCSLKSLFWGQHRGLKSNTFIFTIIMLKIITSKRLWFKNNIYLQRSKRHLLTIFLYFSNRYNNWRKSVEIWNHCALEIGLIWYSEN
jgi:hypothetical protein